MPVITFVGLQIGFLIGGAEGRSYVQLAFWIIFFPGLFVAMTVLAINLVGDGLRHPRSQACQA